MTIKIKIKNVQGNILILKFSKKTQQANNSRKTKYDTNKEDEHTTTNVILIYPSKSLIKQLKEKNRFTL